jgi:cyclase
MLKRRLIPVLFIKNGLIVRSEDFSKHQIIGNIINEAKRYDDWEVDELIYIDISEKKHYDFGRDDHKIKSYFSIDQIVKEISKVCFMPLTLGGGIRTIEDIDMRIRNGADKITLNTGAIENINLVQEASLKYGSQCVVISIDYRMMNSTPIVFSNNGSVNTRKTIYEWIEECEDNGAGEIFLNAIDKDGKANGFDIATATKVVDKTRLPVIVCGGAGNEFDILELAEATNVSAIAVGNWFHFVERSYSRAKELLKKNNINVR